MRRVRHIGVAAAMLVVVMALPVLASAQGMMGPGWGYPSQAAPTAPVTIEQAVDLARQSLGRLGNPDLVPVEVMEFTNNFYVLVAEKSTGIGAFEMLVTRNGFVRPEPGPNMMWNTKYGHMAGWSGYGMMGGGMMGGPGGPAYAPQPATPSGRQVTRDRARQILQVWLSRAFPGAKAEEGMPFYGYFTFDFERNGKVVGMASVNMYSGQVWYHNWHGAFVREKELK